MLTREANRRSKIVSLVKMAKIVCVCLGEGGGGLEEGHTLSMCLITSNSVHVVSYFIFVFLTLLVTNNDCEKQVNIVSVTICKSIYNYK